MASDVIKNGGGEPNRTRTEEEPNEKIDAKNDQ